MAEAQRDTRLLFNLGILALSQLTTQLLNLAALVLVARWLGAHDFGLIQLGVAISMYALLLADMGLLSLGIREVARLDTLESIGRYLRVHLGLLCVLALGVLALGWAVLPRTPFFAEAPAVFLLYLAMVLPQVFMLEWVTTGLQNLKWTGIFWVLRAMVYALLIVVVLPHLRGTSLSPRTAVPLLYLISFTVADLVIVLRLRRLLPPTSVWPVFGDLGAWRARLADAIPIGLALVVMRILFNVDVLMLGLLDTPESAGVYAAASKLVFVIIVGSTVVWRVLLPRLSQLWIRSPQEFRRQFTRFTGLAVAALAPVAVGGSLVGARVIAFVYDDQYARAGSVLRMLSVSYPVLALGIFFGNGLIACNRQRAYLPSAAAASAAMILLTLWLVPRHGALGASTANVLASSTLALLTGWQMRHHLTGAFVRVVLIVAAAGAVMAAVLRGAAVLPWFPLLVLGLAGYAAVALPLLWRDIFPRGA